MRSVFADTGYWIALLNRQDDLHRRAVEVSQGLGGSRIFTTEMVLVELLNYYAATGTVKRNAAANLVKAVLENPNVTVVTQTGDQFKWGRSFRLSSSSATSCGADIHSPT